MVSSRNSKLYFSTGEPRINESVLIRAVTNVFRPLIRLLIGRISLKKLQKIIEVLFVEETEDTLKLEAPGKNVALADLAYFTGIDTRTIKKIKADIDLENSTPRNNVYSNDFMPMFKVFDLWLNDERFYDADEGKPKELDIEGEGSTFSELVKTAIQSRGLTTQLVLRRLKNAGIVYEDPNKHSVKLLKEDNIFISKDELDALEVGFKAIANLAGTVRHNIQNLLDDDEKFFQRGCWNYQFSPEKIIQTRKAINLYLKKTDLNSRDILTSLAESNSQKGQITAGISIFYFEE